MARACDIAHNHQHHDIRPAHLLVALAEVAVRIDDQLFKLAGLDPQIGEQARAELQPGPSLHLDGKLPHADSTRITFICALQMAQAHNNSKVLTRHFLRAMSLRPDDELLAILKATGIELPALWNLSPTAEDSETETGGSRLLWLARYTDRLRHLRRMADIEMSARGHEEVLLVHCVYGFLRQAAGVGYAAASHLGIDTATWMSLVDHQLNTSPTGPILKDILGAATSEARELDHNYVGTEDFLLACVRLNQDDSLPELAPLDYSIEQAQAAVLRVLGPVQR